MRRVLVLAGGVDDQLETVARGRGRARRGQIIGDGPLESAGIVDAVGDRVDQVQVCGCASEEKDGDGSFGGGFPLDGETRACWDDAAQARRREWVADRVVSHGLVVGIGQWHKAREACSKKAEEGEVGHVE